MWKSVSRKTTKQMKKVYHLKTCSTCQRIIKELGIGEEFELQNVKEKHITAAELDAIKEKVGSYEALFNRRSKQYRGQGLHEMELTENDYRQYILQEYTLLKRPIILIGDEVFVGNSKKVVASAKKALEGA